MKEQRTTYRLMSCVFSIKAEITSFFIFTKSLFFSSLLAICSLLGSSSSLFAQATGGQPLEFMSYGAGARSLAMGAAFVGVADDASATYWNPAGLSQITRKELTLLKATLFADTTYDFYSFVKPSKKGGSAWGVSLTTLANTGFEKVTTTYDPNQQQYTSYNKNGTFGVSESAMSWAYGRKVVDHVSIG